MTTLITGANRGIGRALAARYGALGPVIGTARSDPPAIAGVEWASLDVTDPDSFTCLARAVGDRALDLLICNAGINLDKTHRLEDGYHPDVWAQTFAVNVTGVFLTIRTLLPQLEAARAPRIAIISSQMASSEIAGGNMLAYRASKSAVLNLGRNLATEFRDRNIAVGIYHPGWVRTDMGGDEADLSMEQSADGLVLRLDALSMDTTGVFETWDGRPHPY